MFNVAVKERGTTWCGNRIVNDTVKDRKVCDYSNQVPLGKLY